MKKVVLLLILCIPIMCFSQQQTVITLNYHNATNILSATYTYCLDQCVFPNVEDRTACACNRDCLNEEYEQCLLDCENEFGASDIAYCKQECSNTFGYGSEGNYWACFNGCGTVNPSKTPWKIAYRYWATWAFVPLFPSLSNRIYSPYMTSYFSNATKTFHLESWEVFHPWPIVAMELKYILDILTTQIVIHF